jgi:hypothetical protein
LNTSSPVSTAARIRPTTSPSPATTATYKGPNLTAIDPDSGAIVVLFHPRRDHWDEHFSRQGARVVGTTPTGRATVRLLAMNALQRLELRST